MEEKSLWTYVSATVFDMGLQYSWVRADDDRYWAYHGYSNKVPDHIQQELAIREARIKLGGDKKIHLIEKN